MQVVPCQDAGEARANEFSFFVAQARPWLQSKVLKYLNMIVSFEGKKL